MDYKFFRDIRKGERAYEYLNNLVTRSNYCNLWDKHPPFQIDGYFGGIAGIANMLVQDRNGQLKLLPALPTAFANGYVQGLRIKQNKSIDIYWADGKLLSHKTY
jgi:alpha-L-fucosidase 2